MDIAVSYSLGTGVPSLGVTWQELQGDHSLPSSAEVNKWSYNALTHPHAFMGCTRTFTYTFYKKCTYITTQCEQTEIRKNFKLHRHGTTDGDAWSAPHVDRCSPKTHPVEKGMGMRVGIEVAAIEPSYLHCRQ